MTYEATGFAHLDLRIVCHSSLQVSRQPFSGLQEIFNWVQVRALARPLKGIHSLLQCLGCVLWIIALLEGVPSAQFEVLNALDLVSLEDISVLCSIQLSLKPDQLP